MSSSGTSFQHDAWCLHDILRLHDEALFPSRGQCRSRVNDGSREGLRETAKDACRATACKMFEASANGSAPAGDSLLPISLPETTGLDEKNCGRAPDATNLVSGTACGNVSCIPWPFVELRVLVRLPRQHSNPVLAWFGCSGLGKKSSEIRALMQIQALKMAPVDAVRVSSTRSTTWFTVVLLRTRRTRSTRCKLFQLLTMLRIVAAPTRS